MTWGQWFREWVPPSTLIAGAAFLVAAAAYLMARRDRKEKAKAKEEALSVKHVAIDAPSAKLVIRIGNDADRAVVLESVDFFFRASDSDTEPTARAQPVTMWCSVRVYCADAITVPLETGRTRDFTVQVYRTPREVAQLRNAIHGKAIYIRFITKNRRVFEFGADIIGDRLLQLLTEIEDGLRASRLSAGGQG